MIETALRARAFGLDLELSTAVDGLERRGFEAAPSSLAVLVGGATAPYARWNGPIEPLMRLGEDVTVERNSLGDHRVRAAGCCTFLLSVDLRRLDCIPDAGAPDWCWQRMLVAYVLPLAAILRGYDVLLASAVALDGGVVALVGPPGSGKTAVALNLVAEGATLFSADMLTLDGTLAHPGSAVATARRADAQDLAWRGLELMLAPSPDDWRVVRVALPGEKRVLPLRAVCVLERSASNVRFAVLEYHDPGVLLDSTLKLRDAGPDGALRQLASCAALTRETVMRRVQAPAHMSAQETARRLLAVL